MTAETHSQLASFIWSICNLLRGPYKRNEYRKVILPLTVLRRFDCVLAATKADVLKEHAAIKAKPENIIYKGKRLLVVDCLSSSSPVYLKNGNTEEFYVRAGPSSAALPASEMTNYIQQRYH